MPGYAPDCRATLAPDVLVRTIGGENFLLHVPSECYFGLNGVGSRIFELLTESPSIAAAFERARFEFDVDHETLQADFDRLVAELLQKGLLELHASPVT